MNAAHLHLIVNHFPIGGVLLGGILLVFSFFRPNLSVARTGMGIIVLAGLIAVPTYLSGGAAEEIAEKLPGVSERFIKAHEEAAEKAIWLVGAAAAAALIGIASSFKRGTVARPTLLGILALAGAAAGTLGWTNELGGEIRHPEIRGSPGAELVPNSPATEESGERDDD